MEAGTAHDAIDRLLRGGPAAANRAVMAYRAHQLDAGLASATINRRLAALRSMVRVGRLIGLVNWSLEVENVKAEPRGDMRGPGLVDLQAMTRHAAGRGDGTQARRDRAILALLFDLGPAGGPSSAGSTWPTSSRPPTAPRRRCGSSARGIGRSSGSPCPAATAAALAAWIAARGDHAGPLFHRLDGRDPEPGGPPLRRVGAAGRPGHGRGAKVGRAVRPHGLRHAAITAALDAGKDVRVVQRFSRHKTLDMVLKYDDDRGDIAGEIAGLLARRRNED